MSIEGQCHFFTIYFSGFVCFVLYKATISDERLQDHWSSGITIYGQNSLDLWPKPGNIVSTYLTAIPNAIFK